jgi:hypothetical protein
MAASNLSPPSRALTDQAQWHLTARTQQDRQPSLVSKLEFITQLQEQSFELSHTWLTLTRLRQTENQVPAFHGLDFRKTIPTAQALFFFQNLYLQSSSF